MSKSKRRKANGRARPTDTASQIGTRVPIPPPTVDEIIALMLRFMSERALGHPEEAAQFGMFVAGLAEGVAPAVERLKAVISQAIAQETPSTDGEVN